MVSIKRETDGTIKIDTLKTIREFLVTHVDSIAEWEFAETSKIELLSQFHTHLLAITVDKLPYTITDVLSERVRSGIIWLEIKCKNTGMKVCEWLSLHENTAINDLKKHHGVFSSELVNKISADIQFDFEYANIDESTSEYSYADYTGLLTGHDIIEFTRFI